MSLCIISTRTLGENRNARIRNVKVSRRVLIFSCRPCCFSGFKREERNYRQRCSSYFHPIVVQPNTISLPIVNRDNCRKKEIDIVLSMFFFSTVRKPRCAHSPARTKPDTPIILSRVVQKRVQRVGHNKPPLQDTKVHHPPEYQTRSGSILMAEKETRPCF